jgi:invasion protein IalB
MRRAAPDNVPDGKIRKRALRRTALFLGGAFLAVAIPALYFVLGAPSAAELVSMSRGQPRIVPGFIGMAKFGQWRLICVPGPSRPEGLGAPTPASAPATAKAVISNACRINQEMPASPQNPASAEAPVPVIVAANFRLVGPKRMPAAMLRLPVTARPGDPVGLRFDDGSVVQTMVRDCAKTECLAAGTLTQADWEHLSTAKSLQVTFPVTGRQWVLLDLPLQGLSTAIAALQRAEISPPS